MKAILCAIVLMASFSIASGNVVVWEQIHNDNTKCERETNPSTGGTKEDCEEIASILGNKFFQYTESQKICHTTDSCDNPITTGWDWKIYTLSSIVVDNYHQECWDAGSCQDDGATICAWCGKHDEKDQYCCGKNVVYNSDHKCANSVFGTIAGHHCVTEGIVEQNDENVTVFTAEVLDSGVNPKRIEFVEGAVCPTVVNKDNWLSEETGGDTFSVSVEGNILTVTRTDQDSSWGMYLLFECKIEGELPPCECKDLWMYPETGDGFCFEEQYGCVNCDDDVNGTWCQAKNIYCKDLERDEQGKIYDWFYCDPLPDCECEKVWSRADVPDAPESCKSDQDGCVNCDGRVDGMWCVAKDNNCQQIFRHPLTGARFDYFYCERLPDCECGDQWSVSTIETCKNQSGCANCNNNPNGHWCAAKDSNCHQIEKNELGEPQGWFYCDYKPPCECKETWKLTNMGAETCQTTQIGCTNCDDHTEGHWCMAKDENCDIVERTEDGISKGWFYCNPCNTNNGGCENGVCSYDSLFNNIKCECNRGYVKNKYDECVAGHIVNECEDLNWDDGDYTADGPYNCKYYVENNWCENCGIGWDWDSIYWGPELPEGVLDNCCVSCGCEDPVIEPIPHCRCQEEWSDPHADSENCLNQKGCTNCDNDSGGNWCNVIESPCIEEEYSDEEIPLNWFYCENTAQPSPTPTAEPSSTPTPEPTPLPEPVDNYHQECWDAGSCQDDGATICAWCGKHDEKDQYCCGKNVIYDSDHKCTNSIFGTIAGHHCVTEGIVEQKPVDNYHQECWDAGSCQDDGATICAWCGKHHEKDQYCCGKNVIYDADHKCANSVFGTIAGHHCVTEGIMEENCSSGYIKINTHGAKAHLDGIYEWNESLSIARHTGTKYVLMCCTDKNVWRINSNENLPCISQVTFPDESGCTQNALFDGFTHYYYYRDGWQKDENTLIECSDKPKTIINECENKSWNDGDSNGAGPFDCYAYEFNQWCANCGDGPEWNSDWGSLANLGLFDNCCVSCGCKNPIYEGEYYAFVANSMECDGSETNPGSFANLEDCARACKDVSNMFIYGTNDFGETRCDSNGFCNCYCETAEPCEQISNNGYKLYRFEFPAQPSKQPSYEPTNEPTPTTLEPYSEPTKQPTFEPSSSTFEPTAEPTNEPTSGGISCSSGYIKINTHGTKAHLDGIYEWNESLSIARHTETKYVLMCCTDKNVWRINSNENLPCTSQVTFPDESGCTQNVLFDSFTHYYYYRDGWQKDENALIECSDKPKSIINECENKSWDDGDSNGAGPFDCYAYEFNQWCANCGDGPKWNSDWGNLANLGLFDNCCVSCGCKNPIYEGEYFAFVANSMECDGSETNPGSFATLEECAWACKDVSNMFIYGTNDFGETRCDSNGFCNCYCETAEPCVQISNNGYKLYRFEFPPQPSKQPSYEPTSEPTSTTFEPSLEPTKQPTFEPSSSTFEPTAEPTNVPTSMPTHEPTSEPSSKPTDLPTSMPTHEPTSEPSSKPTDNPTLMTTKEPSSEPTDEPTSEPSSEPTDEPSTEPIVNENFLVIELVYGGVSLSEFFQKESEFTTSMANSLNVEKSVITVGSAISNERRRLSTNTGITVSWDIDVHELSAQEWIDVSEVITSDGFSDNLKYNTESATGLTFTSFSINVTEMPIKCGPGFRATTTFPKAERKTVESGSSTENAQECGQLCSTTTGCVSSNFKSNENICLIYTEVDYSLEKKIYICIKEDKCVD